MVADGLAGGVVMRPVLCHTRSQEVTRAQPSRIAPVCHRTLLRATQHDTRTVDPRRLILVAPHCFWWSRGGPVPPRVSRGTYLFWASHPVLGPL